MQNEGAGVATLVASNVLTLCAAKGADFGLLGALQHPVSRVFSPVVS